MKKLLLIIIGFSLGCSSLWAQVDADKKLKALEKSFTPEQKRLFHEYVDLRVRQQAQYVDPMFQIARTLQEIRAETVDFVAAMPPERAKLFWRDLPYTLKRDFRRLNPLHVSADERKAAENLPARAKDSVAKLLSDDVEVALAARRQLIAHGPACRALVADQAAALSFNSSKRLRHDDVLAKLDLEERHERRLRVIEHALKKASDLEKDRKKANSTIAVLIGRNLCDFGQRSDPYGEVCYYNFIRNNRDYDAGTGLCYGNGDGKRLGVNFFGGQDNRIKSLGAVNYADVKKAPNSDATAKWWKGLDAALPMTAVIGHVYLLHLVNVEDKVDLTVKLKILAQSPDEWIIFEWEPVPQEK